MGNIQRATCKPYLLVQGLNYIYMQQYVCVHQFLGMEHTLCMHYVVQYSGDMQKMIHVYTHPSLSITQHKP